MDRSRARQGHCSRLVLVLVLVLCRPAPRRGLTGMAAAWLSACLAGWLGTAVVQACRSDRALRSSCPDSDVNSGNSVSG